MAPLPRQRSLRVLHLEDSEVDHDLALAHLRQGGRPVQTLRVDSEAGFRAALDEDWDAILSDYNMPGFSGLEALEILKASGRLLPFIIVSGEIGEETAVQAMRNGAGDYLLKSNLARLSPALDLAIEANETRRARVAADRELAASRQQLSALAQHLQTSVERERAAIAREIHDDVGGALAALNFDLAWIARHSAGTADAAKGAVGDRDDCACHRGHAARDAQSAPGDPGTGPGHRAAVDGAAFREAHRHRLRFSHQPRKPRTAHRRAPGGIPRGAGGADQRHQALAGEQGGDRRLAGARRAVDRGQPTTAAACRPTIWARAGSFGIRGLRERVDTFSGWVDLSSDASGTTLIVSIPVGSGRARPVRASTALGDGGPDLRSHAMPPGADP